MEEAKEKISNLIEEGFDNEYISKDEFEAMQPWEKGPAKFYQLFKVHKPHEPGKAPPERPIISGSGSVTENLSLFVDNFIKDISTKHPAHLQDTPDFLRAIEEINQRGPLPNNAILVSIAESALYTNIPQDEGIEAVREALQERDDLKIPSEFLVRMLELVLKYNIFEFNKELFLQMIGTAMGTRAAPSYANIFMARKIDQKILDLASNLNQGISPIIFLKRFLDDIFMIYTGSVTDLHIFLEELNKLHPTIKFTMNHTMPENSSLLPPHQCDCKPDEALPFLDTSCKISNGRIVTDLYRKETDRNQYLLTSSCHPSHVTNNIPFSLALRIVRICSLPTDRDKRLNELKELLWERNYKPKVINSAIEKARSITREKALEKVMKNKTTNRPVFAIEFDPRLPSIPNIIRKHWRTMTADPYLAEVFPLPPLVAYKRPANVRDKIIRSKIPPLAPNRPKREMPGMTPCNNCPICPFVKRGKQVKASATNYSVDLDRKFTCQDKNVIYCIECDLCNSQYIGESERSLQERFSEHKGYVANHHLNKATGNHFNLRGHQIHHMKVTVVEKIRNFDPRFRKTREKMFIEKFNTKHKGMNKQS